MLHRADYYKKKKKTKTEKKISKASKTRRERQESGARGGERERKAATYLTMMSYFTSGSTFWNMLDLTSFILSCILCFFTFISATESASEDIFSKNQKLFRWVGEGGDKSIERYQRL